MTDLSIIIVSWNVADLLSACLDSIQVNSSDLDIETIVVDSASRDHTVAMVRERYAWVTLIPQAENVGFTRGNNIGLEVATGRHLLLLNPDTEIVGDMLAQFVNHLDNNPEVGMIGPHTLNTDGTTQSSRRRFPTIATAFFESTWLQPIAPRSILDAYYIADADDHDTFEVDWVQGHALMVRRDVYAQIGGLDPGYVMYSEELDWCKRAKDAGWKIVYVGDAQVIHHGGKSSDQVGAYKYIHFNRSKIRYFNKHHGAGIAVILRVFLLAMFGWQILSEGLRYLVRHKPKLRRERVGVYWQVIRSGLRG